MISDNASFYKKDILPVTTFAVVLLTMPFWFRYIGGYSGLDTKIVIWIIFAIGFDILLGYMGFLSFGHAAFFGTSAYFTGLMLLHYSNNILPAITVGVISAIIMAFIIGFLTLKRTGIYFSILTLAFGEMLHSMVLSTLQDWTGGDNGLTGLPTPMLFDIKMQGDNVFYLTVIVAIVMYYIARRIIGSPFGLMLKAIKSNQVRLEYTGVHVARYKLMGFVISAVYAGVAGALMIVYEPYVASEFMGWHLSGQVVIMTVLGGVGTLFGPMLGAAFMLYFENVVSVYLGAQWLLVLGAIFMATVIFLPGGFVEAGSRIKKALTGGGK
ncbi:MAG TPA: branched-chain amino acid ABC transporter permease [Cycloclasticus sp.]|jgi:ABC-type branched-subunit amino acid transport system permease subunit|nr:branched-chain amino acid ABC transporter permease [Cycloclasticus sp.]